MDIRSRIAPLILFSVTAVIYLLFPTRVYYWDGIVFAQAIEDASRLSPSLVHPNHLIYNFAGYFFYKLLRALGADIRALTALQILNSLLSALCASVLFSILMQTLRSFYFSICLALLFAFSATWWKFSTDANAYIPSVLFLLISFYLVLPGRKPRPLLTAFTFFISMAFHQLAVLMFPVLALGVYLQEGPTTLKRRALNAVYFSAIAIVLIVAAYAGLFYLARGEFDPFRFIRWTISYSPDADTKFRLWSNLQYSLRGLVRLFFGGRLNSLRGLMNPAIVILLLCLIAAILFFIFNLLQNLRWPKPLLATRQKTVLLLSLLWAGVYTVFLFFWLPQNTFYRLFYLPALIIVLGLALASVRNTRPETRALAAFVIAAALANFLFLIYPSSHAEKYPPLAFALQLNREWPAGTVIFYMDESSDVSLVRYFTPQTRWLRIQVKGMDDPRPEMQNAYAEGRTCWFETSAIDTYQSDQWFQNHARKETLRELNDGAYRIRFVQVY
ncbi:MAG TPA: hypothetical protein VFI71_13720 [Pyrinomonadaceae bacterium]|nr:hypothetical protein [Pyrinomonadaceae bacterium]